MKSFIYIFAILAFSCEKQTKKEQAVYGKSTVKENYSEEKTFNFEHERLLDSIRFSKALILALSYTKQNISKYSFTHTFNNLPDDRNYYMTIDLKFGYLFSKDKKHLLVRRINSGEAYLDIFLLEDKSLIPVFTTMQPTSIYIDDTIRDINGDTYADFLVHWYPMSGCCLRDIYNVYLYLNKKDSFSSKHEFINPTFYPQEKIIRGVEYGPPGGVGLYKYKWNRVDVETIEYINPDKDNEGNYFKTKKELYLTTEKERIKLKSVPKEYKSIESYTWFTGI